MSAGVTGTTPGFKLDLVDFDWPRWHEYVNGNFSKLDAILRSYITSSIKGVWQNSTTYAVGDKALDLDEGLLFVCKTAHTSSATGTFSADRVAHPLNWSNLIFEPSSKGAWQTGTSYNLGNFVSNGSVYAYCVAAHISGVWATDLANGYWEVLIDASSVISSATTKASKRNRHFNPGFQICQDRAVDATIVLSANNYIFDGFFGQLVGGGALTCSQAAKTTPGGSLYRGRAACSTADTDIQAGDIYGFIFRIEGSDIADLGFGTAAAKSFIWRGVVNMPAGKYGLSFANQNSDRSYVHMFTVSAGEAKTDKLISVVVPGDTSGTWNKGSNSGIVVRIALAIGSTRITTTTDTWIAGNYWTTSAQTNGMASTANVFEIADIGLYEGTVLPNWELTSYVEDLIKCRRYYRTGLVSGGGYASATVSGFHLHNERFGIPMVAVPSVSFSNVVYSNCSAIVAGLITRDGFNCTVTATATTNYSVSTSTYIADARL